MKSFAIVGLAVSCAISACTMDTEPVSQTEQADVKCARPDPKFNAATCVKESNKELCWDNYDNNCDGCIDEGCPTK